MVRIASQSTVQSKGWPTIPFFERQRGGLCRMHALNAYLAAARPELDRPAYSESAFKKEIASFDTEQYSRFGTSISATDYDAVFSDQRCVIGYILAKHRIYVRHIAIGAAMAHVDDAITAGIFFVYNANHVWIMIHRDDSWLRVDSISGVIADSPSFDRTVGLLIPIKDIAAEFSRTVNNLRDLTNGCISRYIREMHTRGQLLGDAETLIGSAIAILEVQLNGRDILFPIIGRLISDYYAFAKEGQLDPSFTLVHLPKIVRQIYLIYHSSFEV